MAQRSLALGSDGRRKAVMFVYEKRLQYPIKIKNTNLKLAALIIS